MRAFKLLLLFTMTISTMVIADPQVFWNQNLGGEEYEYGRSVRQTSEGGFIITGESWTTGGNDQDILLIKTDSEGNPEWIRTYGGELADAGYCAVQTEDGGYLIAGAADIVPYDLEMNLVIIKTDDSGDSLWSYTLDNGEIDRAHSIVLLEDGSFIVAGEVDGDFTGGAGDALLMKMDSEGNVIWMQTYDIRYRDSFFHVEQLEDSGFILSGVTSFDEYAFAGKIMLFRADSEGNQIWFEEYGWGYGAEVKQTEGGGFAVCGRTSENSAGSEDAFLLKTDDAGNLLWFNTWGTIWTQLCFGMTKTADGGFVLTGTSYEPEIFGCYALHTIRADSEGYTIGEWMYSAGTYDYGYDIMTTEDGNYVITGSTSSPLTGYSDVLLMKIDDQLGSLVVNMIPDSYQITIPAQGGHFSYDVQLSNNSAEFISVDFIVEAQQSLMQTQQILRVDDIELAPGESEERSNAVQFVPARAEAGDYIYLVKIYEHGTNNFITMDQFHFEKSANGFGSPAARGDWEIDGIEDRNDELSAIPADYTVLSAFPNPFNPVTNISYYLPEAAQIELSIYDIQGKLINIVADGWEDKGSHLVYFDAGNLSSGVYFARLSAGEYNLVKKLILTK